MTNPQTDTATPSKSVILRAFGPSNEFEQSQELYGAIGFQVSRKSRRIALVSLGEAGIGVSYLLQAFYELARGFSTMGFHELAEANDYDEDDFDNGGQPRHRPGNRSQGRGHGMECRCQLRQ